MTDLPAIAASLRSSILAHREAMDRDRRLPQALADEMARAGFYRMLVPSLYGGGEVSPATFIETLEALGEIDASAAWIAMIGATAGLNAAYLDDTAAREIFGDPRHLCTGVFAPMGRAHIEGDMLRVSGRWKWNSGGHVSHWLGGGCILYENGEPKLGADGAPEHRMVMFPASKAMQIDTWHTSGLKGTGSGDMSVEEVRVPSSHAAQLINGVPKIERPLYAFPLFGLLSLGIAGVASGNARGAIEDFKAMANGRRLPNGRSFATRSSVRSVYAEAVADYGGARAFLLDEAARGWAEAQTGGRLSIERRARLRLAATAMVRRSTEIVRRLQDAAGGPAVFLSDPLHRRSCDAQVMTAHMMVAPATLELTGGALLNGEVDARQL